MKVYLVDYYSFGDFLYTEKLFTSKEKAEKYIKDNGNHRLYDIVEMELEE